MKNKYTLEEIPETKNIDTAFKFLKVREWY